MGIHHAVRQYQASRKGVIHATMNPEGPGAVRIHLIPPRFHLWDPQPYVVILNGYYILPLGYSYGLMLGYFLEALQPYDGKPMQESDIRRVMETAVRRTKKAYYMTPKAEMRKDLEEILQVLFDVAYGKKPSVEIGAMSLKDYAANITAPHRMDLMVSAMTDSCGNWNCNLKCRNCYAAGQEQAGKRELTTQEWKTIIDRCKKAGIPQLTFTGGEPTMRADLPELIDYARWFVTRVNTNGVLLTPELCRTFREVSLDSIQITVYSWNEDTHNCLVGADLPGSSGNFRKTLQGLRCALEAGLDVSVNTPICRENDDYEKTLEFLCREGVGFVSCSGLIETGKAAGGSAYGLQLSAGELSDIVCRAAAFCGEHEMELSFTSPGRADLEMLKRAGLTIPACGACLSNMAVAPDGTVVPCQSWLGSKAGLGNMLTDDWKTIWNHPLSKKIRSMSEEETLKCPLRSEKAVLPGCETSPETGRKF